MPGRLIVVLFPAFRSHAQCRQFVCAFTLLSVPFGITPPNAFGIIYSRKYLHIIKDYDLDKNAPSLIVFLGVSKIKL